MKPIEAILICGAFIGLLMILAAILENTVRGQRFLSRLLVHFLGEPESEPTPIYRCCVSARAGHNEAGYWLHRVREHGEGAA